MSDSIEELEAELGLVDDPLELAEAIKGASAAGVDLAHIMAMITAVTFARRAGDETLTGVLVRMTKVLGMPPPPHLHDLAEAMKS